MTKLKFLSDEHIDLPAVKALKERNIDIVSVQELGRKDCKDIEHLKFAEKKKNG